MRRPWACFWLGLFVLDALSVGFLLWRGRHFHAGLTALLMPAELFLAWDLCKRPR